MREPCAICEYNELSNTFLCNKKCEFCRECRTVAKYVRGYHLCDACDMAITILKREIEKEEEKCKN